MKPEFIKKIKSLCPTLFPEIAETESVNEFDPDMIGNIDVEEASKPTNEEKLNTIDIEKEKSSFHKILTFLWCVATDHKAVHGTQVTISDKNSQKGGKRVNVKPT